MAQEPPGFLFRPRLHEPGEQTVMGRHFRPARMAASQRWHSWPATPPPTDSLATKLVTHFVAD